HPPLPEEKNPAGLAIEPGVRRGERGQLGITNRTAGVHRREHLVALASVELTQTCENLSGFTRVHKHHLAHAVPSQASAARPYRTTRPSPGIGPRRHLRRR